MKANHEELTQFIYRLLEEEKAANIFLGFKILIKKYPNDADLGAEVRKLIKLAMKNE